MNSIILAREKQERFWGKFCPVLLVPRVVFEIIAEIFIQRICKKSQKYNIVDLSH